MRVVFEKVVGGVKTCLCFSGSADFFDFGRSHHCPLVAKGVSDVGEDGGQFFVWQLFKGGHGNLTGVFFPLHFDGAEEAVEGEFNEAFFVAIHPLGSGEWREHGGGEALAIGLVAGDAVAFAGVDFVAFLEEQKCFAIERRSGVRHFLAGFGFDDFALKLRGGGFEDRLEPFVDGVFRNFLKDGKALFWFEPGRSDGGLEANAGRFVGGGFGEDGGLVVELGLVTEDLDGGGADLWVFCRKK